MELVVVELVVVVVVDCLVGVGNGCMVHRRLWTGLQRLVRFYKRAERSVARRALNE